MKFTRSKEVQKEYKEKKETLNENECFICDRELLVAEFTHWALLKNRYPYKESKNHYLLCPKRHIQQRKKLNKKEKDEFKFLISDELKRFGFEFDIYRWNTKTESSFRHHIHCQIIELNKLNKILWKGKKSKDLIINITRNFVVKNVKKCLRWIK